jgi:broad specificity phosphatase PhoE
MTTLLLIRHGETDWNAEHRWQGHADVPLNAHGREQAKVLAEELAPEGVDAIYSSDLSRARDTAEIVGERLGVPVVLDPDLREIDVGSREGLTGEEVGDRPWDGEPHETHGERILRAVRTIAERHPDERVAVDLVEPRALRCEASRTTQASTRVSRSRSHSSAANTRRVCSPRTATSTRSHTSS